MKTGWTRLIIVSIIDPFPLISEICLTRRSKLRSGRHHRQHIQPGRLLWVHPRLPFRREFWKEALHVVSDGVDCKTA